MPDKVTKSKYPTLSFNKAFDALSRPGSRMMIMHTKDGDEYFIVPGQGSRAGGRVTVEDARKIMKRTAVIAFDDGLFPGHEQSWKIAGT